MITTAIENSIRTAWAKKWDKTYWAIDIHGTILKPNFSATEVSTEFYPDAIPVLQLLSKRKDVVRILYTCSYPHEIEIYLKHFAAHDIHFDYVNQNPEVSNGAYGYYKEKFYFNVLLEDKAGFDPASDWARIGSLLKAYPEPEEP
ncbi:hypothetical protein [Chryseolinea lacunae]|uniref:Uncharacterized protein n=1 Tax=Chryseolinea lacunae TaxID=2801331 RepID=A0ABS1KRM0_9BACT|nr:hypothetical protein [Chryseolinea lacunae]MBL0742009.1 hypothetical protein [Chryseolinea lacunae]